MPERSLFGSWLFTVVRLHGLHFLRPEKSWRPIVEVAVHEHRCYERVLGCNGENPNIKEAFAIDDATSFTKVEIKIWHKGQSKKKGRKRTLVSTTWVGLGEILQKQGSGARTDIRLNSGGMAIRKSRSKIQGGAYMTVKVCPPGPMGSSSSPISLDDDASDACSSERLLSDMSSPTADRDSTLLSDAESLPGSSTKLRRRRCEGFHVFTDEEEGYPLHDQQYVELGDIYLDEKDLPVRCDEEDDEMFLERWRQAEMEDGVFVATDGFMTVIPSLLPRYTDQISVASSMTVAEWVLDGVSPYQCFKEASVDSDWEKILNRLQTEWYFIGGALVSLAALFAAVFGFSSGTLFVINDLAQRAVAFGSIASGVGICIDAWLIFSYSGADATKFQRKARDLFGTYFFFCMSARVPALCMLTSSLALMLFLLVVAWETWSSAVLAVCFFAGTVLSLQFILYGVHRFVLVVVEARDLLGTY